MIRILFFAAAAFGLAACASTPTYAPATTPNGAGYSQTQVEGNRYFVTYRASGGADAALLQDYALLRAADIALERGANWFWVDRRTIDSSSSSYGGGPCIGIGVGGVSGGGNGGVGASVGMNFPLGGGGGERARSATLEMRLGEGAKPDEPNAYDARSTAANLRSRIATAG